MKLSAAERFHSAGDRHGQPALFCILIEFELIGKRRHPLFSYLHPDASIFPLMSNCSVVSFLFYLFAFSGYHCLALSFRHHRGFSLYQPEKAVPLA